MPMNTEPFELTPRQMDVLTHIEAYQSSRCYSATIGELAKALSLSRPTVYEHIVALREKNLVTQSNGRARCLSLTAKGKRLIGRVQRHDSLSRVTDEPPAASVVEEAWTLAGRVCAGYGIDAIEEPQPFSVTAMLGAGQGEFVLKVVGSSMIGAGIFDGDYIVCRPAAVAENGQIVVALLDGQTATLKRFFKDHRAIRLQPANDAFEPIVAADCSVRAVVTGVIRKLAVR